MGSSKPKGLELAITLLKTGKYIFIYCLFGHPSTHPNKVANASHTDRGGNRGAAFISYFPACPAASSALARFFPALEAAGSVMKPRALSG